MIQLANACKTVVEEAVFTLVRQISLACTTFNFQLLILIYSCDLLMIIGLPAA